MFTGSVSITSGSLSIVSPLYSLRTAALNVGSGFSASTAVRIGELTGGGNLTISGSNELRLTTLNDATYSAHSPPATSPFEGSASRRSAVR